MHFRLQRLLAEAHQCADQARQREEETRNQYHEVAARMHRAEAMNEEFEAELTQVHSRNQDSRIVHYSMNIQDPITLCMFK